MIEIREYMSSDYQQLLALLDKTYNGCKISQRVLEKHYIGESKSIIVAVDKTPTQKIVGCMFLEECEDYIRPNKVLFVTYVAVDREYRRCGIGQKLMDQAESYCVKRKCSAIELTSADHRTGAHAFYGAFGFSKKKTTHFIKVI